MVKFDKYKSDNYKFPMHELPSSKKGKEWSRKFGEAIYSEYLKNLTGIGYNDCANYALLRSYAEGRQPIEIYMNQLVGKKQDGDSKRKGYYNADWSIFSVAPKFMALIIGMFEGMDHDVHIDSMDKFAMNEKEEKKWQAWFEKENIQFLQQNQLSESEFVPSSMEELNIYEAMGGLKLKAETAFEVGVDYTYYMSGWEEIKRKLILDLSTIGIAGTKDYLCPITGKAKVRYVNPSNAVVQYSRRSNFDNTEYAGEFIDYNIADLRVATGWSEEMMLEISNLYNGKNGNPNSNYRKGIYNSGVTENIGFEYDATRVIVLDAEVVTFDREYCTKKKKNGNDIMYRDGGKRNRKQEYYDIKVIRRFKWVVGTEYVFDEGLQYNIPRPKKEDAKLSYNFYRIPFKSIIETIKPNLDALQLAWIKLSDAINSASKSGIAVEMGSLENITIGDKMKPLEILRLKRQTGDLIYRATTHAGKLNSANLRPVTELKGGIGPYFGELIQTIEMNIQFISELSGIDRISAVSKTPTSETPVGTTKMAVAATQNTLRPIYSGYIEIKQGVARNTAARIQSIIKTSKEPYVCYANIIGMPGLKAIELTSDYSIEELGIKMVARPSQEELLDIERQLSVAMQAGKDGVPLIDMADYFLVKSLARTGAGVKYAQAFLSYRAEKKRQQQAMLSQQTAIAQQEEVRKNEILKAEIEKQRVQLETESKIKIELAKVMFETYIKNPEMAANNVSMKLLEQKAAEMSKLGGGQPQVQQMGQQQGSPID